MRPGEGCWLGDTCAASNGRGARDVRSLVLTVASNGRRRHWQWRCSAVCPTGGLKVETVLHRGLQHVAHGRAEVCRAPLRRHILSVEALTSSPGACRCPAEWRQGSEQRAGWPPQQPGQLWWSRQHWGSPRQCAWQPRPQAHVQQPQEQPDLLLLPLSAGVTNWLQLWGPACTQQHSSAPLKELTCTAADPERCWLHHSLAYSQPTEKCQAVQQQSQTIDSGLIAS